MIFATIFVATDFNGEKFLNSQDSYNDFPTSVRAFTNVWDLMNGMGDWKAETYTGLLFYYILTVFVNIGMLNIVISVVSDIYEQVSLTKR